MHIFPQLRKLEEKYNRELVVVGVHSPKFTWEHDTRGLRKAVMRHHIRHPVVNDKDFQVWSAYGCRAWPTLIFLTPDGKVVGKHEGEAPFQALDSLLGQMVQEFDERELLSRSPMDFQPEGEHAGPLSFPGKVLADAGSGTLHISDTGHNRVIVGDLEGNVRMVVGDGEEGLRDGDAGQVRFNQPQGLALVEGALYVADTENHAVRRVDLNTGKVTTVAGTGEQGGRLGGEATAVDTLLSSPWDLVGYGGTLFIAMAGVHQIWALELKAGTIRVHAGSGREAPIDGPLMAASLDQPSGITTDGQGLYFADSEASAVRTASVEASGRVGTIVGRDLFVFGDVDGTGEEVRLQHPLGICWHDGSLYVADTYNHKVKRVLSDTRRVLTLAGTGAAGYRDGPAREAQFHEPSGLSVASGKLYVADTNNHAVRVMDLAREQVSTLVLRGL